jgi:hypothetical protein
MKKLIYSFALLSLLGCGSSKKVIFKTDTFMSGGKESKFEILIPKGYEKYTNDLQHYILRNYTYPDSSVIYISLDFSFANSPNYKNWIKCSNPAKNYKCEEGQQDNGKYWKEVLKENVVIGYYNVRKDRKEEFDKTVSTLKLLSN